MYEDYQNAATAGKKYLLKYGETRSDSPEADPRSATASRSWTSGNPKFPYWLR